MTEIAVHIGMDDIDSPTGSCTTHFASLMVEVLSDLGVRWLDYPLLIRLNPNVPFRTRGNGAVALRFMVDDGKIESLLHLFESHLDQYVRQEYANTNPGVALLTGEIPAAIVEFAHRALWRVVPRSLAFQLIDAYNIQHLMRGNGRGLIGALAALGNTLSGDYTFELLAYRHPHVCGRPRGVVRESVLAMDQMYAGRLFSNIDSSTGQVLIEPHGPDPVLFGIRGDSARDVIDAASLVRSQQSVNRWTVFRTNQGTNQHLTHTISISGIRPYMAARVTGLVSSTPRMTEGGHVLFSLKDKTGSIDCAAYEPTRDFRNTVLLLRPGDLVTLDVGVRSASRTHGLTLNVEGLQVHEVATMFEQKSPLCPICGRRMTSAGSKKGFKCVHCGHKAPHATKISIPVERSLRPGYYLPPPSAQRHLTRPLERKNKTNDGVRPVLLTDWWWSSES